MQRGVTLPHRGGVPSTSPKESPPRGQTVPPPPLPGRALCHMVSPVLPLPGSFVPNLLNEGELQQLPCAGTALNPHHPSHNEMRCVNGPVFV
ncbi:hypothetical protein AAFF_G00067410 [Aldrovandia affinis]|uniref:Uncharacterized protein n=1 Tax=Aldrovandia affinis TaxID=143900 RepID=A0AAD7T4G4_9TELE|nr:hypothetical protein AAFF_G00067410 [Aldrovandia affinis]